MERRRASNAIIISLLVEILHWIEKYPWGTPQLVVNLIYNLDEIAAVLLTEVPRKYFNKDIATYLWLRNANKQKAASTHNLKKWIITPKPDTREHFINWIVNALHCVATGTWDGWERMETEPLTVPQFRARLWSILRTTLSALIPLALFLTIQQIWSIDQTLANTLGILAFAWAVISLIALFDPQFGTKVSTLSTLKQLLPFKVDEDRS